jgi:predicted small metal-binding protein
MKRLACRDIGLDCDYIVKGEIEEEVIRNAVQHAWEIHA